MSTAKDYWGLIKTDYSVVTLIIMSIAVVVATYFEHWSAGYALMFWFTAFDILGYRWVLRRHPEDTAGPAFSNPAYRIIQHGTFFLILLLWIPGMWQASVIAFILWMTGWCDLAFYWLAKVEPAKEWPWLTTWLWIFPAGAIAKYNKTSVSLEGLYYNMTFGLILSIGVLWF